MSARYSRNARRHLAQTWEARRNMRSGKSRRFKIGELESQLDSQVETVEAILERLEALLPRFYESKELQAEIRTKRKELRLARQFADATREELRRIDH